MKYSSAQKTAFIRCLSLIVCVIMVAALVGCVSHYRDDLPEPTVRQMRRKKPVVPLTMTLPTNNSNNNNNIPPNWLPPRHLDDLGRWHGIVIHHSAGDFGDAAAFDREHRKRGWDGLGYHFVINNGKNNHNRKDGIVEVGRRWIKQEKGAHCRIDPRDNNYWNEHTIGICLVGNFEKNRPSPAQWRSLVKLVSLLRKHYNIPLDQIKAHRDIKPTKCPGKYFSLNELKRR